MDSMMKSGSFRKRVNHELERMIHFNSLVLDVMNLMNFYLSFIFLAYFVELWKLAPNMARNPDVCSENTSARLVIHIDDISML